MNRLDTHLRKASLATRWCVLSLALVTLLGAWLRASGLSQMLFHVDEFLSLCNYDLPWRTLIATYDDGGTGVPLLLLQKASAVLFGANELTLRLPALVPGLLIVPLAYFFFRVFFGSRLAVLGAGLVAVSHYAIFYSAIGRIYSLYLLIAMGVVVLLVSTLERPRGWKFAGISCLLGLALFCHLGSAAFVVTCGAYVVGSLLVARAPTREWVSWAGAFTGAALLALVLYAPTLGNVAAFVTSKAQLQSGGGVDLAGILHLYAGGKTGALLFAVLVPVGLVAGLRAREPRRVLVGWVLVASLMILLMVEPVGTARAHARYVIYAFPFLLVAVLDGLAFLYSAAVRRLPALDRTGGLTTVVVVFALVYWSTGFEGWGRDRGSSVRRLGFTSLSEVEFSVPPSYEDLAREATCERVIEFPFFRTHARGSAQLLYMKYREVHGRDVYVGEAVDAGEMNRYVNVLDLPPRIAQGACLVFHKDIGREMKAWGGARARANERTQRSEPGVSGAVRPACWLAEEGVVYDMKAIRAELERLYGAPWREDESVSVFRLPARP